MLRFILLTGLYLLGAWYAVAFIHGPEQVTLFWPSSGIAYAAVLRYGWRSALFIPVAMLIAHLTFVPAPAAFIPFSVMSNLCGVLAGALTVSLTDTPMRITMASGFGMLRGALVMVTVSGLVGCTGLIWSGMMGLDDWWPALAKWSMGDLLGVVSIAPSMLILTAGPATNPDTPRSRDYSSAREKTAWLIALVLSFATVYWSGNRGSLYALAMVALPLSLLLWSAIRFQPIWTILSTSLVVLYLTSLTGLGLAGFTPPTQPLDSAMLLGFMCLISLIPLVLVAAMFQQRMATRKVLRRAMTDASTGLPNRAAFEDAAMQALSRPGGSRALAYLDLDHFTLINDTASHAAGDALIHGVASLLKARVSDGDRVFRIGGDEFALLLEGDPTRIEPRMQDLLRAIENYRVGWRDHVLNITGSIGLVAFEHGQLEFARLLSLADAACFTAKELGGNRVCLASQEPGETQERTESMRWAVRIREALDGGLFELDCQAIVPLHGQAVTGRCFEVLLRMRDPVSGQRLAPGHFIPAAERFQLGVALDRHVVELALGWLEARPDATAQVDSCAINLTAASLVDEGFRQFLFERVRDSRIPAHKLCFEVTETSAVRDLARAQVLIGQMRSLGCAFSLDDFGTGFCSFNYLHRLDVDYFKIDGSFVRDLESSPLSTAVVRAITDIAHVLNKQTVAEHTEDESICSVLRELGVDFAQGFGIHKPQPIEQYFAQPPDLRLP
ncbi:MAG TPA: EAL domain-containing protein [Arenimonas sp.]|uniref:putative bifunctional diguanylate cyclase/phosphodiesterase n=1 Tax=Arenimonas sp. TaxID=1872635 RepID=UPI002C86BAC0|nr:EAL domain-containing protein [Arenimonas sp.]HMB57028.1 EAL domain-containing protein [Arenimonas sp.]